MQLDLSFASPVDRRSVYPSEGRRRVLALLSEGLVNSRGFLLLTGDAGVGKTLLVQDALAAWSGRASVAWVGASSLERSPLGEVVARFGIPAPESADEDMLTAAFDAFLTALTAREELAVLAVDDAHDLSNQAFDALLRMVEPGPPARRLHVLMVGRPELETRLADDPLAAVCDRLSVQCRLDRLTEQDTERYLRHRVANGSGAASAPSRALSLVIHALGAGNPRAIDRLVDDAMRRFAVPSPGALSEAHVRVTAAILAGEEPPAEIAEAAALDTPELVTAEPRQTAGRPNGEVGPPRAIGPSSHAEVSEWVSRFIGEQGPPRIGSRLAFDAIEAEVNRHEQRMSALEFSTDADTSFDGREVAAPVSAGAEENATPPPPRRMAPAPRRVSASRGRRPLDSKVSFTIAAVLGLVLAAILLVPRVRTFLPSAGTRPAVQDSIPRPTRTTGRETSATRGGTASSPTIVLTPSAGTAAAADTVKKITVWRGLEVASYLSADRASEEQQRLSSLTGLSGQVIQSEEDGTGVYRVVLGCYRSRSRAEKAAAWLLNEGYVTQARTLRIAAPVEMP